MMRLHVLILLEGAIVTMIVSLVVRLKKRPNTETVNRKVRKNNLWGRSFPNLEMHLWELHSNKITRGAVYKLIFFLLDKKFFLLSPQFQVNGAVLNWLSQNQNQTNYLPIRLLTQSQTKTKVMPASRCFFCFPASMFSPCWWAAAWRPHTNLHKLGWNISPPVFLKKKNAGPESWQGALQIYLLSFPRF